MSGNGNPTVGADSSTGREIFPCVRRDKASASMCRHLTVQARIGAAVATDRAGIPIVNGPVQFQVGDLMFGCTNPRMIAHAARNMPLPLRDHALRHIGALPMPSLDACQMCSLWEEEPKQ